MWNRIRDFFSQPKTERQIQTELASKQALDSHMAFMDAASSTMMLAQDVTATLKGRIDDYSRQIEATSFVLGDALFMVDHLGVVETFNPAAEQIFGFSSGEIVGHNIDQLFKLDGTDFMLCDELLVAFSRKLPANALRARSLRNRIQGVHKAGHGFQVEVGISSFVRSDDSLHYLFLVRDMEDERAAEAQVVKLSQKQKAILEAMPDIVCTFDTHYRYTSMWSPSGGYRQHEPEDNIGRTVFEVLPLDKAREFIALLDRVRGGETFTDSVRYSLKTENGPEQTYSMRFSMCGDEVLLVARNVTEHKRMQDELEESMEHFRAFGQASNEAMLIHDEHRILSFNPRLSEMTGFSTREIAGMVPMDFVYPMEREKLHAMQDDFNIARSYDTLFLTRDGLVLEVSINAKPVEWKNKKARINVIRDITHLKDFEQILNISRERYRTISDNTVDLVCYYDANLNIKFSNQTFKDYFNDQEPANLLAFVHGDDHEQVRAHVGAVSAGQPVRRTLHRVVLGDGVRWQDWIDRAVFDEHGTLLEIQGVGRDVTDYVSRFTNCK